MANRKQRVMPLLLTVMGGAYRKCPLFWGLSQFHFHFSAGTAMASNFNIAEKKLLKYYLKSHISKESAGNIMFAEEWRMTLDFNNPIPRHVQLKEILRKEIEQGNYTDKIPSERELMERFSVSRTTVREAVSALVRGGFLEKIHGKGTFITTHKVNEWLGNIRSFTDTVKIMGMEPGIQLLFEGIKSSPEIAEVLGVKDYYAIERLRFADGEPIAIERTYYPLEIGLKLAEHDLNSVTLYTLLESIGVILHEAEQKITSVIPIKEDARLLGISPDTSVLAAERLTLAPDGHEVEYYHSIFRADRYAFCIKMSRKNR